MKKVMVVFGTRPDTIKLSPVILELQRHPRIKTVNVATAQHRELLDQVLGVFGIKPDYDLNVMRVKQSLFDVTGDVLSRLEEVLTKEKPDLVVIQGDTTTTFVAALAAFYHQIPIAHVEAGLRTKDKYNPFPEEINRRLTSVLADLHFAPTQQAVKNLLSEGVDEKSIHQVGNTVIDALLLASQKPCQFDEPPLSQIDWEKRILLVTAHRRESWGEPLSKICQALKRIVARSPDVLVIFPVHKNPIVREVVYPTLKSQDRIHLIEPPEYLPFVHLMKASYLILTDSGGIQEEAPSLGKPVLVSRKTTERPEGIKAGTALLVGTEPEEIVKQAETLLTDKEAYRKMAKAVNPYGDGKSAKRIISVISDYLNI